MGHKITRGKLKSPTVEESKRRGAFVFASYVAIASAIGESQIDTSTETQRERERERERERDE